MRSKTKPKATKPKEEDKTQSERFIETARMLGADSDNGKAFSAAIDKILKPKIAKPNSN